MAEASGYKASLSLLVAPVVASLLAAAVFAPGAAAQEVGCKGDIVLDPGHGGTDPGALNKKYGLTPANIAETVFITSDREGRLLSDGTGTRQQQIAQALQTGIENYLATH